MLYENIVTDLQNNGINISKTVIKNISFEIKIQINGWKRVYLCPYLKKYVHEINKKMDKVQKEKKDKKI